MNLPKFIQPKGFAPIPDGPDGFHAKFESLPGGIFSGLIYKKKGPDPSRAPRVMVIVHGHGEHCGRYLHFVEALQSEIDAFFIFDLFGHGRSEGTRGDVPHFGIYAKQTSEVIETARSRLADVWKRRDFEVHLYGHSMGGLIVLSSLSVAGTTSWSSVSSIMVSAPALGFAMKVPTLKRWASSVLSKTWGGLQLATKLDPKGVSSDPEVVKVYMEDRLNHDLMTPRLFEGMVAAMQTTVSAALEKSSLESPVPILFLIPMQDPIIDPWVTLEVAQKIKAPERCIESFETFLHEAHNEIGKEKVFEAMLRWFKRKRT